MVAGVAMVVAASGLGCEWPARSITDMARLRAVLAGGCEEET